MRKFKANRPLAYLCPTGFVSSANIDLLQGTTGKELLKLTDDILAQIGVKNPLHRMQLINTRDDLLAEQEQDAAVLPAAAQVTGSSPRDAGSPHTDSPVTSKPSSPTPSYIVPQHSPKVQHACYVSCPSDVHSMLLCWAHNQLQRV